VAGRPAEELSAEELAAEVLAAVVQIAAGRAAEERIQRCSAVYSIGLGC
jgi:hypothetical protein